MRGLFVIPASSWRNSLHGPRQLGRRSDGGALRSVEPSTMSLLGLVRRLAEGERATFRVLMAGLDAPRLFCSDTDRDDDFDGAVIECGPNSRTRTALEQRRGRGGCLTNKCSQLSRPEPVMRITMDSPAQH